MAFFPHSDDIQNSSLIILFQYVNLIQRITGDKLFCLEPDGGYRMRRAFAFCFLVVILAAASGVNGEGIREQRPTLVYGELGGKAVIFSMGIERYFTNVVGVGAGMMGFGSDEGFVGLFPVYLSLNPVGDIHSLYLSAGTTIAAASNWDETESNALFTGSIGYQYQSEGGFFVRPTLNIITDFDSDGAFFVLPGVAIGGSF